LTKKTINDIIVLRMEVGGKMKIRITKKIKGEIKELTIKYGYWSEEVRKYIEDFDFISRNKLHQLAQYIDKYGGD
jgi:hypothetical protein